MKEDGTGDTIFKLFLITELQVNSWTRRIPAAVDQLDVVVVAVADVVTLRADVVVGFRNSILTYQIGAAVQTLVRRRLEDLMVRDLERVLAFDILLELRMQT